MTSLEKQLTELTHQLRDQTQQERRLVHDLEAALQRADSELQADINRIQASHIGRRRAMMASLLGLAKTIGTLPASPVEGRHTAAIDHTPEQPSPQETPEPESLRQIADFTRDLRARGGGAG